MSQDAARLQLAFTGLERSGTPTLMHPALAAILARLGRPAEAWQALEEDFGRGLPDDLAAGADRRLAPGERARLRELTSELEKLDKLVESTAKGLDQAPRAKLCEDLKRQRVLASIALGDVRTRLVQDHGTLAGQVAGLGEIQAALAADAALVTWVDIAAAGPNAADPDGEHWELVVGSQGGSKGAGESLCVHDRGGVGPPSLKGVVSCAALEGCRFVRSHRSGGSLRLTEMPLSQGHGRCHGHDHHERLVGVPPEELAQVGLEEFEPEPEGGVSHEVDQE
jgi:hypothetical protein